MLEVVLLKTFVNEGRAVMTIIVSITKCLNTIGS